MNQPCQHYREQIDESMLDDKELSTEIKQHIDQCHACQGYYQGLRSQDQAVSDWIDSLEPVIESGCDQVLQKIRKTPTNGIQLLRRNRLLHRAIAAILLIAAGLLAGRMTRPAVDTQELFAQWQREYTPQLKEELARETAGQLREEMTAGYRLIADQLRAEIELTSVQTMAAGSQRTEQLLVDLIQAIDEAQVRDRQWVVSALNQIEETRLEDQAELKNNIAAFAVYTGDELARTREQIKLLCAQGLNSQSSNNY